MIYHVFVEGIYQDTLVESFEFSHAINAHASLFIRAMITNEQKDDFLKKSYVESTLTLKAKISAGDDSMETEERILFCGLVDHITIEHAQDIYYINIFCQSYTSLMDMLSLNQSFQDGKQTFDSVIQTTMDRYGFYQDVWQYLTTDTRIMDPIQTFFVRYKETDWQFVQRVVSHLNLGLVADIMNHNIHFWVGIPEGKNYTVEDCPHIMSQAPQVCAQLMENDLIDDGYQDIDFVQYILVKRLEVFFIGDHIRFRNLNLVVKEIVCEYSASDGLIYYQYTLATEKGMVQPCIYNALLRGASIDGIVIDRKRSYTRLHLTIDEKQPIDESRWITQTEYYTGGGEAGMVGMPELNTRMSLYFPSEQEEDAQIFHTHNLDFNHISDFNGETYLDGAPTQMQAMTATSGARDKDTIADAKLMYGTNGMSLTTEGTELDEHILLRGNKQESKLLTLQLDQAGITLKSPQNIDLASKNVLIGSSIDYATEAVHTNSKKVQLSAENEIMLQSGMSSLILDASKTIHLKALDLFLQIDGNEENSEKNIQDNVDRPLTQEEIAKIEAYNRAVDEYNAGLEDKLIRNIMALMGQYSCSSIEYQSAKSTLATILETNGYSGIEDLYASKIEKNGSEWHVSDVTAKRDDYYAKKDNYYNNVGLNTIIGAERERNAFEEKQNTVWNEVLQGKYGDVPDEVNNDPTISLATKQIISEEAMPYKDRNERIKQAKAALKEQENQCRQELYDFARSKNCLTSDMGISGYAVSQLSENDQKKMRELQAQINSNLKQSKYLNNETKKVIDPYVTVEYFFTTVVNGLFGGINLLITANNFVQGTDFNTLSIPNSADYSLSIYIKDGVIKEGHYLDYMASPAYLRQIQPNAYARSAGIGTLAGMIANYFIPDPTFWLIGKATKGLDKLFDQIFSSDKIPNLRSQNGIWTVYEPTENMYSYIKHFDNFKGNFPVLQSGSAVMTKNMPFELGNVFQQGKKLISKISTGINSININPNAISSLFNTMAKSNALAASLIRTASVSPIIVPKIFAYSPSINIPMSLGQPLIRERDWLVTDGRVSSDMILDVPTVWSYPLWETVINSYVNTGVSVDVWDQTKGSTVHTQTSVESADLGALSRWIITTLPYFDFQVPSIVFVKTTDDTADASNVVPVTNSDSAVASDAPETDDYNKGTDEADKENAGVDNNQNSDNNDLRTKLEEGAEANHAANQSSGYKDWQRKIATQKITDSNSKTYQHIVGENIYNPVNVTTKRGRPGISGSHNEDNFMTQLNGNGGRVINRTPHPTIDGIYEIEYEVYSPAMNNGNGGFRKAYINKTVYDPNKISDIEITKTIQEGLTSDTAIYTVGKNGSYSVNAESNGLNIEGYYDPKEPKINSAYPVFPQPQIK